jgi:mannose-6-phosphate isomerase-like protein (cupin superfamily)
LPADAPPTDHFTTLVAFANRVADAALTEHAHECSDRVLFVISGKGVFHVSDEPVEPVEPVEAFRGEDVQSIPVARRDVVAFRRGVVHTFSTLAEPMVLLSFHRPFVPLDDPRQFTLPATHVCPGKARLPSAARPAADPCWLNLCSHA